MSYESTNSDMDLDGGSLHARLSRWEMDPDAFRIGELIPRNPLTPAAARYLGLPVEAGAEGLEPGTERFQDRPPDILAPIAHAQAAQTAKLRDELRRQLDALYGPGWDRWKVAGRNQRPAQQIEAKPADLEALGVYREKVDAEFIDTGDDDGAPAHEDRDAIQLTFDTLLKGLGAA